MLLLDSASARKFCIFKGVGFWLLTILFAVLIDLLSRHCSHTHVGRLICQGFCVRDGTFTIFLSAAYSFRLLSRTSILGFCSVTILCISFTEKEHLPMAATMKRSHHSVLGVLGVLGVVSAGSQNIGNHDTADALPEVGNADNSCIAMLKLKNEN